MSQTSQTISLYQGMPDRCSYLEDKEASNLVIDPGLILNPHLYSDLLAQGFRRSGDHVYRPHCSNCQACIPVRIPVKTFIPRRIHRRILRANQDLALSRRVCQFKDEHFQLFKQYLSKRHIDGPMTEGTEDDYVRFLCSKWCDTAFLEWRLDGRLVAVAVTDQLPRSLSAVYTFFDPDVSQRSLGTYAILRQINLSAELNMQYLYLGYWIQGCQKMAYKADFQPIEARIDNQWHLFSSRESLQNAVTEP